MRVIISIIMGYLLGAISPSALVSKIKKKNLREHGTKNLGATNTLLNFGKGYAALVLVFDMFKAYAAYKLAQLLLPKLAVSGLIAGGAAVAGHIFPFYMKFKGGKGLASLGGVVLAHDPMLFLILLAIGVASMLILNYSFALPISASILLPVFAGIRDASWAVGIIFAIICSMIIYKHWDDIIKTLKGEVENAEVKEYIKNNMHH